jgi:hypothetical protein
VVQPSSVSVLVDWNNDGDFTDPNENITADVGSVDDPDAVALRISRGGAPDFGSGLSRGSATIVVRNDTGKYTRDNGSSVLAGNLKAGRPVWITAVHSGTTYGCFAGYLSRIVPEPSTKMATLICDGVLERFARQEASVPDSTTRSLDAYRGAILDAIGEVSTRRTLPSEPEIPAYSGEASGSALDLLGEVNASTLSRHFVRAGTAMPNWYFYTVRDRHYKLDTAALFHLNDNLEDMSGYETADDTLINDQFASAAGRTRTAEQTVWTYPELPLSLPASTTRTYWVKFTDPVVDAEVVYAATGSPSVVLTHFGTSAKVVVTSVAAASITDLHIVGSPAVPASGVRVRTEDAASIASYGRYTGTEINATLLATTGQVQGLADHMVFRFKAERSRPVATVVNLFPEILQAEPFEPINVTFSRLSLATKRFEITGIDLTVSGDRNTWRSSFQLQEAPEQGNPPTGFFTLNTDTLNSAARLGY